MVVAQSNGLCATYRAVRSGKSEMPGSFEIGPQSANEIAGGARLLTRCASVCPAITSAISTPNALRHTEMLGSALSTAATCPMTRRTQSNSFLFSFGVWAVTEFSQK